MENKIKEFKTSFYEGAWFYFSGDRMRFRETLKLYLREKLLDPTGELEVNETGPHWIGNKKIHLSYTHSEDRALLVFSSQYCLGADIEKIDRVLSESPLKIAERYFHPEEYQWLKNQPELKKAFISLWVKKEALGKLSKNGLKEAIHLNTLQENSLAPQQVPLVPTDWIAYCCFSAASN